MIRRILLLAWLAVSAVSAPALAATEIPPSPIVRASLAVHAPEIRTGQPVWAAVTFTMPEHWHIYWQNPGDSGIPTTLGWTLPEGLAAGETLWPVPERIETAGLVDYGYSNAVTLPVPLTPARDGAQGEVEVKASWLVCKDICIPESATLRAPLAATAEAARMVEAARKNVPVDAEGWHADYQETSGMVTLTIHAAANLKKPKNVTFFPIDNGIIANYPAGSWQLNAAVADNLTLTFPRGNADLLPVLNGVVSITHADNTQSHIRIAAQRIASNNGEGATSSAPAPLTQPFPPRGEGLPTPPPTLLLALGLAFLGGLILNIMPCVLPILALKALALAKKAGASRRNAALQGLAYTAGVVASFLVIAAGMLALKQGGAAIGWGFQLQNPFFVGFLALVMLLVAANLLGWFELPVLLGGRAVEDSNPRGALLTGALAVLVATPCTAPFMATAIGATLSLPATHALAVFAALGFGMAAPFLLISLWPAARRLLPKPGAWMVRLRQWLALPMLATAAWLIWVLVQLTSPTPMVTEPGREAYSAARLADLRARGTPVLVDATAAWCLSCKVNERVAINPPEMQAFFRERGVTLLVADWTRNDPEITKYLAAFGRNGVPLYVYYPPQGEGVVLPQILTPALVRETIDTTL